MDKRLTFNEDAANYDKWRPAYCAELFRDIIAYSRMGQGGKVIEIGLGTGQATRPFLETGCELAAIELGADLAEYSQLKFREHKNFRVHNTTFEEFTGPDESADLIYSATAFHWIPEDVGYSKVRELLKKGGTVALFWNRPFAAREDDELHQHIQRIYQQYRPSNTKLIEHDTEKYQAISQNLRTYGFKDIQFKLYHLTRSFSSADYIALLNTYSDHRSMPSAIKEPFEEEIRAAIMKSGDVLTIYDTIDLHLGRK